MLASPVFAQSERLCRFLRFVVEETLQGRGEQLKEYFVGVEVFDREEAYDPRTDPIVRVEADRLRRPAVIAVVVPAGLAVAATYLAAVVSGEFASLRRELARQEVSRKDFQPLWGRSGRCRPLRPDDGFDSRHHH